ncbi:cullin-2 isoform X1 [Plutella xylostella]|uniref:cullin-2 isoform X1 n=1 Tax=Plutella xylostella TaxID=51655 RepID=UPI002032F3BC|nr:cullin-2 isoform X1 [Plutella xylostella]XP_048487920.1 cullin-2 isoform X2 [Plutella xylostella]XP_048487921.1 cullin-2 isoform X3 [Plutella xylostella]XP_048487922.1 cullin-2 isoform X1 [Plutella xylostella]
MMSLKPRNVDFQETWAGLKETVAGVVGLQAVARGDWSACFSAVYSLCVAHPEPLAARLYDETRRFLEEHVAALLLRVRGDADERSHDFEDGLLTRYVVAWREYSQGAAYLNSLYSYLNLQHVKRQKVSDAEIMYGSAATVSSAEQDARQLEVGELGLTIWERVLLRPLAPALTLRVVAALTAARARALDPALADALRTAIHSTVDVQAFLVRSPLSLYNSLVLQPFLERAGAAHAQHAAALLHAQDIHTYMTEVLQGLEREVSLGARFLHASSAEAVRACYERAAVQAHLATLHAECPRLLQAASEDGPDAEERRVDLRNLYTLLRPLGAAALRPLLAAAHEHVAAAGRAALAHPPPNEAHTHFVHAMLALHDKYSGLFNSVFSGAQAFTGALDKACSEVVNRAPPAKAPELLARYCDSLLRRRGERAAAPGAEAETDAALARAIVVFKYIDDKDVFQKYYARALARRLIHQLAANMEQEEAMINRLKAACGYEFTNKLHRMFTDVAVSADLNAKFSAYLAEQRLHSDTGFTVQVLQAGAWPLGGGASSGGPPPPLAIPATLFEQFYRRAFSGRRLAWLQHLCAGELRTRYTPRAHHVQATVNQCSILLAFENVDEMQARELRELLELDAEQWARQLRPLLDVGLITAEGNVEDEAAEGTIRLNLQFSSKRTKLRLAAAAPPQQEGGAPAAAAGEEPVQCDDDRKMYLQAALVRIMKQRKVLRHNELIQEVCAQARGSFAPSVAMVKKCIEALIDKQYLERAPGRLDTYSYLA